MSTKTYFSIGKKGKLAMAILATLSAGFFFPSLARASTSSTDPITGDIKLTDDYSVNLSTGTGNYADGEGYSTILTPKDDATINIDMNGHDLNLTASSSSLDAYGATITQGGIWNVTNGKGKTITISTVGKDNANGINMLGTSIDVDANVHIVKAAGTNEAFGIYADMGSKSVFKGDVTIENVTLTPDLHDGTYTSGIALATSAGHDTSVTVQGKTTIKNSGDAVQVNATGGVLILGAASLSINDNSVITDKYHAVTNKFGTAYINVARDGVTTGTTNIYGDIFSGSTTKTYLALTDADSTWVGSSDANWGADHVWHGTYLTLQNGATFTNKSLSKDSTHGSRKNWSGSFLNELTGGTSADKAGNIVMENAGTDPLRIQKISGNTNIFYSHEDNTPAAFSNGNVLIDEASKGANIRVITASNGITTSDTTQVKNVLSALAEKIYYGAKNDTIGDDGKAGNLSGTVEIAEGLTSSSQSLKSTALLFNKDADTTVHYDSKRFKYEPSYHQGYASYEESTKQQNEYTIPITGDSTADALYGSTGVTSDYKNYTFSNNTGKVSIDSGSTPAVNVKNKNVTVDASALDQINLDSGIYVSGDKGKNVPASSASVAINGSKIQVHHTGSNVVHAYAGGTLALNGTGDFSADSDTVNAEGTIFYIQGSFPNRVNKASITLNGGSITATAGNALSATGSTIRINEDSKGQTLFNDVTIKGDIRESGLTVTSGTTGSAVDIALTTTPSSWTGVSVLDSSSTLNLLLQNGGTWINEKNSGTDSSFTGSHITTLTGGSAGKAGIIFQNDTNPITVDSYSGNSTVIYKHDADDPTSITGGNFTITKADKDSAITLLTDNSGIDMKSTTADARNRVSEVLNKLAQKLFYTGYTDGNLKGTVEIADGLTASSASLKTGDISYSTATTGTKTEGQGYYDYTPAEDIPSEQTDTEFGQQITGDETKDETYIKAGVLKKGTSPALYKFTKDSTITLAADGTVSDSEKNNGIIRLDGKNADVDATGHTVKLVVPSSTSVGQTPSGIIISGNSNLDFKGNADVSVTGESKAVGVRIPGASLMDMMNPDVVHGGTAVFENGLTVKATAKTGYTPYDVEDNPMGLYVGYKNSSITVKGTTDIDVTSASETNAYGVAVADSEATKAGIKDSAVINLNGDTTIKLHTSHNAYALYAKGGQINVNYDGTGAGTAKVNIDGDLYAVAAGTDESSYPASNTYGEINLALTNTGSSWTGVVENDSGKHGDVNIWLTDGATWTNKASGQLNSDSQSAKDYEKYSYLTTFHGGSTMDKAGIIDMTQGTRGISADNYSGNTLVVYKHEITDNINRVHADLYGNKAANVLGGNFKITDAAAGSAITLVTDNNGVKPTSTAYTDKNLVNDLLDKLANKLYYSGYANGNLKGYVRIAEGLTSSSITKALQQGDISFYNADEAKNAGMAEGQGHYSYSLVYPNEQVKDPMATVIDGSRESKDAYRDAGIYKDKTDTYDFTKKPATVNTDGKSDSIIHAGDNDVNVKTNDVLNINAKDGGIGMKAENGKTVTTTGNTNITAKDGTGILADKGIVKLANDTTISAGTGMEAKNGGTITAEGKANITATGNALHADGDGSAIALKDGTISGKVLAENKGTITTNGAAITGDVTAASDGTVSLVNGSTSAGVTADGGIITTDGTEVAGDALAKNSGTVAMTNGKAASVTADGGTVTTNGTEVTGDALAKANGTVSMTNGKAASVTADGGTASTDGTTVDGLISAKDGGTASMKNGSAKGLSADKDSTITATLDKSDAKLDGNVANEGNASISLSNGASWTGDSTGTGTTTANIGSGSTWTGTSSNGNTKVALEGTWKQTGDSTVDTLTGKGGTLDKSTDGAGETKIASYSGNMSILYSHNESTPIEINGAVTIVGQAADGSSISLITDSKGLSMNSRRVNDRNTVSETFNQLAHKLHYTANDGKLAGRLKIAEGLTSSSAALRTENITFDKDGIGTFVYDPAKNDIAIEYGSDETRMMKGTKSALLGSAMMWRSNNNDIQRRMGDLRLGQGETGVWARYMGGKNKFDQQNTYLNQDYDIGQAGFDKKVGDWTVGFALDHGDGKSHYIGGKGKEKMNTLAIYGTRVSNDGKYFDVIVKTGQVKNKFDVSNEIGNKLHGDYKAWGNSISLEYGKRFVQDSGFYMDPSVEFTAGRLNGKNFKGTSDLGTLYVHQHGFNSAIGRVGFSIGRQLPKSNLYAKFALAHEFAGNFKTDFYADDGGLKSTKVDLGDTWLDMELGGSLSLGKNVYLYGTYTRTFEADMATKWRADVGVRYTF